MEFGSVFAMLIIGALAGWLSGKIMAGRGFGLLGNIVVGIVGAFIAGVIFPALGFSVGGGVIASVFARDHRRGDLAVPDRLGQTRLARVNLPLTNSTARCVNLPALGTSYATRCTGCARPVYRPCITDFALFLWR